MLFLSLSTFWNSQVITHLDFVFHLRCARHIFFLQISRILWTTCTRTWLLEVNLFCNGLFWVHEYRVAIASTLPKSWLDFGASSRRAYVWAGDWFNSLFQTMCCVVLKFGCRWVEGLEVVSKLPWVIVNQWSNYLIKLW